MTAVAGLSNETIPSAEVKKGSGVYLTSIGSAYDIRGLMLCSECPVGKTAYQANWFLTYLDEDVVDTHDEHDEATTVSSENVDEEFAAALDEYIHKFELDKISAGDFDWN